MFTQIKDNIESVASLEQVSEADCNELRNKFPGIQEDYLNFLHQIGFGNLGDIQLYEGPVGPSSIYGEDLTERLDGLIVFGDDFQGYCFAFDSRDSYKVVELSPAGEIDKTVEDTFIKLLEGYFN